MRTRDMGLLIRATRKTVRVMAATSDAHLWPAAITGAVLKVAAVEAMDRADRNRRAAWTSALIGLSFIVPTGAVAVALGLSDSLAVTIAIGVGSGFLIKGVTRANAVFELRRLAWALSGPVPLDADTTIEV